MESGQIVEYIDRQRIWCAVVLEVKKQRLRLLNEANREINMSLGRLAHKGRDRLDTSMGRQKLVAHLKEIVERRNSMIDQIDIKELWEILNSEQQWIDLATMTEFCFPDDKASCDHESAVVRAFFKNRLYFKFNHDSFYPHSEDQVDKILRQLEEEKRRQQFIDKGSRWLRTALAGQGAREALGRDRDIIDVLESYYLLEKDSPHYAIGKSILAKAGCENNDSVLQAFVKLGKWLPDENLELLRHEVPTEFEPSVLEASRQLARVSFSSGVSAGRRDLTHLATLTIDGQSTLDFDDALSIETADDHYRLGIHIADVGHHIKKDDRLDRAARRRGSSIYMPDQKLSMLPSELAEDLICLRAANLRPTISTMVSLTKAGTIIDYDIFPSMIAVRDQLSYHDVNLIANSDTRIKTLHDLAGSFRKFRLSRDAVQISLPEINIWFEDNGVPAVTKVDRESPGRLLVAELMIMANWLTARFLRKHQVPAIFRSQPKPRERLFKNCEGSLFQNWMQRKCLSRFVLGSQPEPHSGLGLDVYTTATSPIRKYFDLITQRQIRSVLGLDAPYTEEDIKHLLVQLETPMSVVGRMQFSRSRYWLLKYLQTRTGQSEEAIVLGKRRNSFTVLLTEYMLECTLPQSNAVKLKPEDYVRVKIQHVNPRKDTISVFLA